MQLVSVFSLNVWLVPALSLPCSIEPTKIGCAKALAKGNTREGMKKQRGKGKEAVNTEDLCASGGKERKKETQNDRKIITSGHGRQ